MENQNTGWPKVSSINILAMLIVLVLMGGLGWVSSLKKQPVKEIEGVQIQTNVATISYDGRDDTNALALLKENAEVKTQDSSMGSFVTEINGVPNTETQFWMYYVNGEQATVAADQYQTKNGDKIEWRFETIQ